VVIKGLDSDEYEDTVEMALRLFAKLVAAGQEMKNVQVA